MLRIPSKVHDLNNLLSSYPTIFNQQFWEEICHIGLSTSKIRLVHSSILLYRDSDVLVTYRERIDFCQKLYRLCDMYQDRLRFYDKGSTIDRKSVGEAIGVAIGAEILYYASNYQIKPSNIHIIKHPQIPSPDYFVKIKGQQILKFEVKGRQNASLKTAINTCSSQLAAHSGLKYAFITKTNYNFKSNCTVYISDPEVEEEFCEEKDAIVTALVHFAHSINYAGYYQFAERLLERSKLIDDSSNYKVYDGMSIENELVAKLGTSYSVELPIQEKVRATTFIPHSRELKEPFIEIENLKIAFLVDENLINLLMYQNFNEILEYRFMENRVIEEGNQYWSISNDGTILYIEEVYQGDPIERFMQIFESLWEKNFNLHFQPEFVINQFVKVWKYRNKNDFSDKELLEVMIHSCEALLNRMH